MQKLTPCLWFDQNAEEAAKFYASIFKNTKITSVTRYGDAGAKASGMPKGTAMTVSFSIFGQKFLGLNGGPVFKFSPAVSFIVNCETQKEIDRYWQKLSEGGQPNQCGWLTDKFGLSWQIVPSALGKMFTGKNPKKGERVMAELMKMTKIDLKILKQAYAKK
ncbi:MAG TPA: VOC family protein [candidate division Zixibacteria bacterium]|nr:VOC family protein [candidate division Zixibacteria bacterium]